MMNDQAPKIDSFRGRGRLVYDKERKTITSGGWFALSGDARLGACATENCGGQPTWRLESGGVGSNYCSGCKDKIDRASSVFMPPESDVSALGKDYLEKRVACMQEAVDRQEWRQNDGDASRPEYWIGRLHEAKIALTNLTAGMERRGDGFGKRSDAAGQGGREP